MPKNFWTLSVVEGDEAVRESICALAASNGWHCRGFETAGAFLEAGATSRPGCLLVDWSLPENQLRPLLCALREQQPALAVVVMTARDDRPTLARIRAAGAGGILPRPFSFAELAQAVAMADAARPKPTGRWA